MPFAPTHAAPFTETGKIVYERTYSRTKQDGSKETWADTVERVVVGNLKLVYGDSSTWHAKVWQEYNLLCSYLYDMKILPGGRHLWATGVGKRQYLANCHLAGWGQATSKHFEFAFMRLMEGGGVGQNYSFDRYLRQYGAPKHWLKLHIVCDPEHKDYDKMVSADVLSKDFVSEWAGCYQIPDTREGWADALVDLIDTYFRPDTKHQDRVYDVSLVRPEGAKLHTFGGSASGPLPLAKMLHEVADVLNAALASGRVTPLDAMEIDHSIGQCVVAGGVRRSARMSILPWDDEYIFQFIACKSDPSKHWTTNISVEINDDFLAAINDGNHPEHTHAVDVHQAVVRGMLENGEPGYWNSSLSNVGEVDWIHGTNPCLTGDTVIATVDGPRTFADLAEVGEDVKVYAWHPETKLPVIRWMRNPHRTRQNTAVLRVEFDSGLVVRCTPDHNFYNSRGTKVQAQHLTVGQSVRAFSASRDSSGHERIHAWDTAGNRAVHQWTHRMLWEEANGPIAEGMVISHLNNDGRDNSIDNLALMTDLAHRQYDMPIRQANGMDGSCRNHKVVSVTDDGLEDVYNGCVDDAHTYIILDPSPVAGHMSGIVSANCGEIPLNEWDVCNLGHINLEAFVGDPDGLPVAHELMTRMLIRATFGDFTDPKQAEVVARNRRIGVGHFGVQGYLVKSGIRYSEAPQSEFPILLQGLARLVRKVADTYCHELRIPSCIKTTTMAPTGSVAKMPGATEGGAPIYARWFNRRIRFSTVRPEEMALVNDYRDKGYTIEVDRAAANTLIVVIPTIERLVAEVEALGMPADMVESCDEISLIDMLEFQAMYQECWADNAVSFTVNFPEGKYNVAETAEILAYYLPVLKGTTLMPDGTREQAPYERLSREEYESLIDKLGESVGESYDEQCASGACPIR